MPARFQKFTRTWLRHHPTWQYRLWGERDLDPFLTNRESYFSVNSWSEKSDVARYEIILRHGGVYVDTDFECLQPIDNLIEGVEAFSATEDGTHITAAIIGATPGHPFIATCVEVLPGRVATMPPGFPNRTTGPGLTTAVYRQLYAATGRQPLTVFHQDLFYPYAYNEPHRSDEVFPHAYAVHHWAGSWVNPSPPDSVQIDDPQ